MKLFLLGFLSGLCTFGVGAFIANSSQPSIPDTQALTAKDPAASTNLSTAFVENLVAENSALRTQLMELRKKTPATNQNTAPKSTTGETANPDPKEISAAIAATQQQISELRDFIRNNPNADVSKTTRQNFEREPIDSAWASDFQLKLSNYFKNDPAFSEFTTQSIECRTHRCRISIAVTDTQQIHQISQDVLSNILINKEEIPKKIIFEQDPSQASLNVYLAKNEDQSLVQ